MKTKIMNTWSRFILYRYICTPSAWKVVDFDKLTKIHKLIYTFLSSSIYISHMYIYMRYIHVTFSDWISYSDQAYIRLRGWRVWHSWLPYCEDSPWNPSNITEELYDIEWFKAALNWALIILPRVASLSIVVVFKTNMAIYIHGDIYDT